MTITRYTVVGELEPLPTGEVLLTVDHAAEMREAHVLIRRLWDLDLSEDVELWLSTHKEFAPKKEGE